MKGCSCLALFFAFLLLEVCTTDAQPVPDTRGRDFYFTFPPNYHDAGDGTRSVDSLFVFIAATEPTQGTVRYRNRNGTSTAIPFTITDVTRMYTLAVPWRNIELAGYNESGKIVTGSQNGRVAPQSFRVTAGHDITVYALSQAVMTSDAMMILPTDVLGTDYMVLSYNSDGSSGLFSINGQSTPSQCAIVATQDNTAITIHPSTPVLGGSTAPLTVRLDAGDSYLLQADISRSNLQADLTGTSISSDKPVAVFAGHQRSTIPIAIDDMFSRDYLVEQMPPVSTWGSRYVLTPFPLPSEATKRGSDLYRVLAAEDNTVVMVDDRQRAVLQAGEYFEAPLTKAATITASRNVLVAQYKKTASDNANSLLLSDPFMLIVPPVRQYLKSYLCINAQAYEGRETVYEQQYLTIICPTAFLHTVRVDDKSVSPSLFQPIGTSCYSYAWLAMSDGPHRIDAETEIGIYMYGYGVANSYGYTGGMAFRTDETSRIVFSASSAATTATPKDTLPFHLKAKSNDWQSIALTSVQLELSYKAAWMQPVDTIIRGPALDSTWRLEAVEREGDTPGERRLVITASGTTPVATSGTIATVQLVMYLSDELHYTPQLHARANNSDFCLEVTTQSTSVDLSLCAAHLRPIRMTGEEYRFSVDGGENGLRIDYGIGLAAPARFEIFDRLGQIVRQETTGIQAPGSYTRTLDLTGLASGLYFIRVTSGPYTRTEQILTGQ